MSNIIVIRLRGSAKMSKDIRDTLDVLRLRRINSAVILEKNERNIGMVKKIEDFVTWGETEQEKIPNRLHPPRGGLKSIKRKYPKGDLGYRGKKIDILIKRMLVKEGSGNGGEKSQ